MLTSPGTAPATAGWTYERYQQLIGASGRDMKMPRHAFDAVLPMFRS